ncbi:DRTGG domain-containing protein [Chloroflexota bacterium]
MAALYITSFEKGVGKTTISAGLGKHMLDDGRKVGFFKPLLSDNIEAKREDGDSDTAFMKKILALEEPLNSLCPLIGGADNLDGKVKKAYGQISQGKDMVIAEGSCEPVLSCQQVVADLGAKVIVVAGYAEESPGAEAIKKYQSFGKSLLGVVLNKIPRSQLKSVRDKISARFAEAGIKILGILPEDRTLSALTIGEMAEHLHGEILNSAEQSVALVENYMLGAMIVDSGLEYFGRKTNKAAVLKGDRPDMQLAALETQTSCLVLSGEEATTDDVSYRAEDRKVPIIATKEEIPAIIASIEDALGEARFHQEKKLPRLAELMEQHCDFTAIYQGLDLAE